MAESPLTEVAGTAASGPAGPEPQAAAPRRRGLPPIGVVLGALFVALLLGIVAILLGLGDAAGRRAASAETRQIAAIVARETSRESQALLRSARDAVDLAATLTTATILDPDDASTFSRFLLPNVFKRGGVSAIDWGSSDGDVNFVMRENPDDVSAYRSRIVRRTDGTRPAAIDPRAPTDRPERGRTDRDEIFDPLSRSWFRQALGSRDAVWSAPYRFDNRMEPTISVARQVACIGRTAACAFGADVSIAPISRLLAELGRAHGVRIFVMTAGEQVVATSGDWAARIAPAVVRPGELPRAVDMLDRIAAAAIGVVRPAAPGPTEAVTLVPFETNGERYLGAFAPLSVETQAWTIGVVAEDFSLHRWLGRHGGQLAPWAAAVGAGAAMLALIAWLAVRRDVGRLAARVAASGGDAPVAGQAPPAFPEFRRLADDVDRIQAGMREQAGRAGEALAEATRADHAKSRFLTQMSHELRTPLNAILGFAELARMRATSRPGADSALPGYLDDVLVSARHLLALIERVLDFARSEASATVLQEERFPIEDALRTAATVTATAASARGMSIHRGGGEGVEVLADRARLCEALVNLIENAVVHGTADTDIDVAATRERDGSLILSVRDAGPGMTREQITVALTPFGRAEPGARPASKRGLGLGLSIVNDIARRHGGTLAIESTPGTGTTVSLRLPAARVHPPGGDAGA